MQKNGPPAETRAATQNGDTVFLRPRPGASRMYPETDIPTVKVTDKELTEVRSKHTKIMGRINQRIRRKDIRSTISLQNKFLIQITLSFLREYVQKTKIHQILLHQFFAQP